LTTVSRSCTEAKAHVERAKMLFSCSDGETVSTIARVLHTNQSKVERTIYKALQWGAQTALDGLPRPGPTTRRISDEAHAWLVLLACQKSKQLSMTEAVNDMTSSQLCAVSGHYHLELCDPEFETKMSQVLHVYKVVERLSEKKGEIDEVMWVILSYDETPTIQGLESKAPDLPPIPGLYPQISRDYEYVRHGTLSLFAGIDFLKGQVPGRMEQQHRSREFILWLKMVNAHHSEAIKIEIVLDNHSTHISKQTRPYRATVPNRFEFIFTPKHGSWLNLIEAFFSKMTLNMLRGLRVHSIDELKALVQQYLEGIN